MKASLCWITPDAQNLIVYMARVSNPKSQEEGDNPDRLIRYLVRNKHWSPFEMASACFLIETTRDIGRQILRHRSFSFQEFSQRYAAVDALPEAPNREARLQDAKNRQSSLAVEDEALSAEWGRIQNEVRQTASQAYGRALELGIAKEVARAVLPEGLTPSRMYMSGTIRSWIHYCELRSTAGTQFEHRMIAQQIWGILESHMPALNAIPHL